MKYIVVLLSLALSTPLIAGGKAIKQCHGGSSSLKQSGQQTSCGVESIEELTKDLH